MHAEPARYSLHGIADGLGGPVWRPDTGAPLLPWPEGFDLVPTPPAAHVSNLLGRRRARRHDSDANLFILCMGPGYAPVGGKGLWLTQPSTQHRALQLPLSSYCIRFHVDCLDRPGVVFRPAWVSAASSDGDPSDGDPNAAARCAWDTTRLRNTVPAVPPGCLFTFYQRSAALQKPRARRVCKSAADTPCPPPVSQHLRAARVDGCLGLVTARVPEGVRHVVLYCRVAFGTAAWGPTAPQAAVVHAAVDAALGTLRHFVDVAADVLPPLVLPRSTLAHTLGTYAAAVPGYSPCPLALWSQAPAGPAWPDTVSTIAVMPVLVTLPEGRPGATPAWVARAASDVVTRLLGEVMLARPELAVLPETAAFALALFTYKTPGLLDVHSATLGVPKWAPPGGETPRPYNDLHPCVVTPGGVVPCTDAQRPAAPPVGPVPPIADPLTCPFVCNLLVPAPMGSSADPPPLLRGMEASLYDPEDGTPLVSGTQHSWVVKGAMLHSRIMTPWDPVHYPWGLWGPAVGPDARAAALSFLNPPDYNVAALQVFQATADAPWRRLPPHHLATRRAFHKPYAFDNEDMHWALWWAHGYPGFRGDWGAPLAPRRTLDVWHTKAYAKAVLEYYGAVGRIGRPVLNRRVRQVRQDYNSFTLLAYACATCLRGFGPGASMLPQPLPAGFVADTTLPLVDAFGRHLTYGEHRTVQAGRVDAGVVPEPAAAAPSALAVFDKPRRPVCDPDTCQW